MISNDANRLAAIGELLMLEKSLEEIAAQLKALEWDFIGDGVELQREHLRAVLHRFLESEISAQEVEQWANLIEGREDICFEVGSEEQIEPVLYELANPELTQALDWDRANALLRALS